MVRRDPGKFKGAGHRKVSCPFMYRVAEPVEFRSIQCSKKSVPEVGDLLDCASQLSPEALDCGNVHALAG